MLIRRSSLVLAAVLSVTSFARADWQQQGPATSPSARYGHSMAFDPVGGGILLFGGTDGTNLFGDTWRWDGTNWTQLAPANSPSPRHGAAMVMDGTHNRILLFGGDPTATMTVDNGPLGDLWQWDGSNWLALSPATLPPGRRHSAMAYDPNRQRVVLFGGATVWYYDPPAAYAGGPGYVEKFLNDTWEWDGTTWLLRTADQDPPFWYPGTPQPAFVPYRMGDFAMSYDPFRQRIVLVGGGLATANFMSWDGSSWHDDFLSNIHSGPGYSYDGRLGPGCDYDGNRGAPIFFGGLSPESVNLYNPPPYDTWDWTGNETVQIPSSTSPPQRMKLGMAFDPVRRRMVMFGGADNFHFIYPGPRTLYNDTWELKAPSRAAEMVFGPGDGPRSAGLQVGSTPVEGVVRFGASPSINWSDYTAANGEMHPACGDLRGDGSGEIVVGLGTYTADGGWLAILDDYTHGYRLLRWLHVPWSDYNHANGATWPAVGDLYGDGHAEIVVGLGSYPTSGGWVAVFGDARNNYSFLGWRRYGWSDYNSANGETRPAVGDVDGDGRADIVIGYGRFTPDGGWLEVRNDGASGFARMAWIRMDWTAYNQYDGGTYPAVGDLDGDGGAEIAIGGERFPGQGGWVRILNDANHGFQGLRWVYVPWDAYDTSNGETHPDISSYGPGLPPRLACGLGRFATQGGWIAVFGDVLRGDGPSWIQNPDSLYDQQGGPEWPSHGHLH